MNMLPISSELQPDSDAWLIKETILDELGAWVFDQLCEALGGQEIAIPSKASTVDAAHVLSQAIGVENAQLLAETVGPASFYIPLRRPDMAERVVKMVGDGLANWEIAKVIGHSERHVRRLLAARGVSNPHRKPRKVMRLAGPDPMPHRAGEVSA